MLAYALPFLALSFGAAPTQREMAAAAAAVAPHLPHLRAWEVAGAREGGGGGLPAGWCLGGGAEGGGKRLRRTPCNTPPAQTPAAPLPQSWRGAPRA